MAELGQTTNAQSKMTAERRQAILSKFKKVLINAARKERLKKLIETKRREQGIDVKEDKNDSPFVPASDNCIDKFVELAAPNENDIIVDLGCGDGRVLIAAAKQAKCKCIGIEIQPLVATKARNNVIQNNLTHLVEIIECDFKSLKCRQILRRATIVFLFLLPKIMPMVTNILSKSVPNGCRVVSYIFDLSRIRKEKEKKKLIQINEWPYPTLGCTHLQYVENKGVFLSNFHPDLERKIIKIAGQEYGEYKLLQVNGKRMDANVRNLYEFMVFKRYLHNVLTNYYQYRYDKDNEYKYNLNIMIEFCELSDKHNLNDLESVKPKLMVEVAKKFKNGSEMRSDLKLYQFPLRESDFGWTCTKGASRIVHASPTQNTQIIKSRVLI